MKASEQERADPRHRAVDRVIKPVSKAPDGVPRWQLRGQSQDGDDDELLLQIQ